MVRDEALDSQGDSTQDDDHSGRGACQINAFPLEILAHVLGFVNRSDWLNTRLVCHRWNRAGELAFDPFMDKQSFFYGVLLDAGHLRRLMQCPRFPERLLRDTSTIAIAMGAVRDSDMLLALSRLGIKDHDCWLTCLYRSIDMSSTLGLECLLGHELVATLPKDHAPAIAQAVCFKQHADTIRVVFERLESYLRGMLQTDWLATWCVRNGFTVALSELMRLSAFRNEPNMRCVLNYALAEHVEPLALAVWQTRVLVAGVTPDYALATRTFFKAAAHNWLALAKLLVCDLGLDPATNRQEALRLAAEYGHVEMVDFLCSDSRVDPSQSLNQAITNALTREHLVIVQKLLDDPRVNADESWIYEGGLLLLALTLEHPTRIGGNSAVVEKLLQRGADPNVENHAPLKCALRRHNHQALCLLAASPRIEMTREEFLQVIAALPIGGVYSETMQKLLRAPRFRSYLA